MMRGPNLILKFKISHYLHLFGDWAKTLLIILANVTGGASNHQWSSLVQFFLKFLPNTRIYLSIIKDVEGLFIETSAKEGDNILEAVTELARSVTIRCSNQLSTQLNKKE